MSRLRRTVQTLLTAAATLGELVSTPRHPRAGGAADPNPNGLTCVGTHAYPAREMSQARQDPLDIQEGEELASGDDPERVLDALQVVRKLLGLLRPHAPTCAAIVGLMLLQLAFTLAVALGFQRIFDEALPNHDLMLVGRVLMVIAAVAAVGLSGAAAESRLGARVTRRVIGDLLRRMFARLQRMRLDVLGRMEPGDMLGRFSGDVAPLEDALAEGLPDLVGGVIIVLGGFGAILYIDWRVALVTALLAPIPLAGTLIVTPRAARASMATKAREGEALARVEESLRARVPIRAFGLEEHLERRYDRRVGSLSEAGARLGFFRRMFYFSTSYGTTVANVAVLAAGAVLAVAGHLSAGSLVACYALLTAMSGYVLEVSAALGLLSQAGGGLARIETFLTEPIDPMSLDDGIELSPLQREIRFERVSFGYPQGDGGDPVPILRDLELVFPAGSAHWLVGPSGSGKSTILHLLLRFADPQRGRITWDGIDIRDASVTSLRRQLGAVFQETVLFRASVAANIRVAKVDATDDEINSALRAAQLDRDLRDLPKGLETVIGEGGSGLSGGQGQRLALARAVVRKPAVLLFDEATSALDPRTEERVGETIRQLSRGRTVLNVSHRLRAIRPGDRVVVLDAGGIVERGTKAELETRDGVFSRLLNRQAGFTLRDDAGMEVETDRLRAIPLLHDLDDAILGDLSRALRGVRVRQGEVIVREGDYGTNFYLLVRGRIRVARRGVELCRLEDGDYFGEIALLEGTTRTATLTALLPSMCLVIGRRDFESLLASRPEVAARLREQAAMRRLSDPDADR